MTDDNDLPLTGDEPVEHAPGLPLTDDPVETERHDDLLEMLAFDMASASPTPAPAPEEDEEVERYDPEPGTTSSGRRRGLSPAALMGAVGGAIGMLMVLALVLPASSPATPTDGAAVSRSTLFVTVEVCKKVTPASDECETRPLAGAHITLIDGEGNGIADGTSGDDGTVDPFVDVVPGDYRLLADSVGSIGGVTPQAPEPIEVVLEPGSQQTTTVTYTE